MMEGLKYPIVWNFDPGAMAEDGLTWHFGCALYDEKQAIKMSERSKKRAIENKKKWEIKRGKI